MPRAVFLIGLIALLPVFLSGCTPSHAIRPYPNFIKTGVQAGDRVEIETTTGKLVELTIDTVEKDALISGEQRIPFAEIKHIAKRSWKKPVPACGDQLPLGCSIPQVIQLLRPVSDTMPRFESACIQHDYCYRHGHKTYGKSRDDCDAEFKTQLKQSCDEPKWLSVLTLATEKNKCLAVGSQMHRAVRRHGEDKFRIANSSYCEYDAPTVKSKEE